MLSEGMNLINSTRRCFWNYIVLRMNVGGCEGSSVNQGRADVPLTSWHALISSHLSLSISQ